MRSACLILLLYLRPSLAAQCSTDGSQYSYSESVNAATNTRTITESGCPSHVWTNINPNYPVASSSTWKVPSQPMYDPASEISLSSQGGATGILFSATQVTLAQQASHHAVQSPVPSAATPSAASASPA